MENKKMLIRVFHLRCKMINDGKYEMKSLGNVAKWKVYWNSFNVTLTCWWPGLNWICLQAFLTSLRQVYVFHRREYKMNEAFYLLLKNKSQIG